MGFTHCIWNIQIVLRNILVLFIYLLKNFLIIPHDMQNLSSPTRDPTHAPWVGNMSLNHWTARQGLTLYSTTPIYTQQKIYMPANLKTQQWPQDWKRSVFIQSRRRAMPKNVQTTVQLLSFHMLTRQCSKSFNLSFNSVWTEKFRIYKRDLEKAQRSQRSSCQHLLDHRKSKRFPEKHILLIHWWC